MPDNQPPSPPASRATRIKLAALSAVGVAMVVLPLAQVLRYQGAELQAALAAQAGLDPFVRTLAVQRSLLAHRDLAAAVLRGQEALEAERRSRQGAVDAQIVQLTGALVAAAAHRALAESKAMREDWTVLAHQVQRRQITAPESDLAHRLLVEQTLQVIDLVADAAALGRSGDAVAALPVSTAMRSLPRLAARIGTLAPAATSALAPADERQVGAAQAALARSLGTLHEALQDSAPPRPQLAAAAAQAGATADRYFELLRQRPGDAATEAGQAAVQAQFRLLDAMHEVMAEHVDMRIAEARRAREVLVTLMAGLAMLAFGLAWRIVTPHPPRGPRPGLEPGLPHGEAGDAGPAPRQDRRAGSRRSPTSRDEAGQLLQRLRRSGPPDNSRRGRDAPADTVPPEVP